MWPSWQVEKQRISAVLLQHSQIIRPLPGITDPQARETLAMQYVASLRRERYYQVVQSKPVSPKRADPNHASFDAERAVAFHMQCDKIDEAAWLAFLMTHFARPAATGWRRLKDVYGRLGLGIWDWNTVSADPAVFEAWLADNWHRIRGKFGNHRKYGSLRPDSNVGTARVVESYIQWIGPAGHRTFFSNAVRGAGNHPHAIYDALYRVMKVRTFGRLGKFDYLSLLGRYGIVPADAGSAYLDGATGPLKGVRLLFDGNRNSSTPIHVLQGCLDRLDQDLQVSMKVMEDALCNWQKSPTKFVHFTG